MSATRAKPTSAVAESVPQQPQVAPTSSPQADYAPFIWQQLGDIQNKLGTLQNSVENLNESLKSTKAKVEGLQELRSKLIGGFWVLGFVVTAGSGLMVWSANKIWNVVSSVAAPAIRDSLVRQQPNSAPGPIPPSAVSSGQAPTQQR